MPDMDDELVSLCADCAVHPDLKLVVAADSAIGLCGICGRDSVPVRNPANLEPMVMLIRALVRFYWDEPEYNPHWGGDSVMSVLSEDGNPVLIPPASDDHLDAFYEMIEWPPYPDFDKGISVYAGSDGDGIRGFCHAISRTSPRAIGDLRQRLLAENFFEVEPDLEALVDPFLDEIAIALPKDDVWFLARLGVQGTYSRIIGGDWEVVRQPYLARSISAPTPPIASAGRLNRQGVSVL